MKKKIIKECNNCYYALDCFMRYVLKSGVCKFYTYIDKDDTPLFKWLRKHGILDRKSNGKEKK